MAADLAHHELHHEDETHLETNPYLCRMWHRRGQQPVLPAAGTNRRLTAFGSVEVFGRGRVEVLCADQSSAGFQLDLEALDQRHAATGREITLVFDNGSAHCSEVTRAALQARAAWLHVIPLARYCPQLNKKEREWRVLKRDARSHLAHSLREFADDILAGLRRLGGERLDIVDRVPDWFIAGHRRPPRPHLGRPKGAKDPPGWRWPWRQPIVGRPMSELSSVLLVGAGLAAVGTAATWPALRRRVRRRKQPTPPT